MHTEPTFRFATAADEAAIAALHALSWQQHYRGICNDTYLDQQVVAERAAVWAERFAHPLPNRNIIVAEERDTLLGFACIEIGEDPQYGTLLDNLHVWSSAQGRGIGAALMRQAAQAAEAQQPGLGFYLWVLEENHLARLFYARMGGENRETIEDELPSGDIAPICRYCWDSARDLGMRQR